MSKLTFKNTRHPYHILVSSPWPFIVSMQVFVLLIGFALYMHNFSLGGFTAILGLVSVICSLYCWWCDIVLESTHWRQHTTYIQKGLRYGMLLFILSEIMFFFSFFWAFFHSSISPSIQIGGIWPPLGVHTLDPWGLPLFNTILLLSSGIFATYAHHTIKDFAINGSAGASLVDLVHMSTEDINNFIKQHSKSYAQIGFSLCCAIALGVCFTFVQLYEYKHASFTISDSIYGAIFYMATGFHGLHVLIGTIFLIVITLRFYNHHFLGRFFFGVDAGVWYWHFVDVIWILLFICIYWWGS